VLVGSVALALKTTVSPSLIVLVVKAIPPLRYLVVVLVGLSDIAIDVYNGFE
jgi:hypothetical protein